MVVEIACKKLPSFVILSEDFPVVYQDDNPEFLISVDPIDGTFII